MDTNQNINTNKDKPTVTVKKADLPQVLQQVKNTNTNINVLEKYSYISEVVDPKSNKVSQPFTINGKKYQMVRAMSPKKEKVMGVYGYDDFHEDGDNIIHDVEVFERMIRENDSVSDGEEVSKNDGLNNSYAGCKHFIVDKKTTRARKFRDISELAKASMGENEVYMGVKDFKRFLDETLFGQSRKQPITELDDISGSENDEEMNTKAKKLMDMISRKIPTSIIKTIKTPIAQREVIAAFAELIGVPRNGISSLVGQLKDLSKIDKESNGQV